MTEVQLVRAIINKAIDGGWKQHLTNFDVNEGYCRTRMYLKFIFNPGFAKAFFGTKFDEKENKQDLWIADDLGAQFTGERWQYHVQQYAILEKPLGYFERFV